MVPSPLVLRIFLSFTSPSTLLLASLSCALSKLLLACRISTTCKSASCHHASCIHCKPSRSNGTGRRHVFFAVLLSCVRQSVCRFLCISLFLLSVDFSMFTMYIFLPYLSRSIKVIFFTPYRVHCCSRIKHLCCRVN